MTTKSLQERARKRHRQVTVQKSAAVATKAAGEFSETPDEAMRRLTNIRPREVSLVDSGANGRRFLVVKRAKANTAKEQALFKNAPATQKDPPAATTEPTTKEAPAKEPPAETPKKPIVKGEFAKTVDKDLAAIPLTKALASEQKDMFLAMSEALMMGAMTLDMIRADLRAYADSDGTTGFMGETVDADVAKALEGIEDGMSDELFDHLIELVAKKGRKMKKSRLDRLKTALTSLSELVTELEDDEAVNKGAQAQGGSAMSTGAGSTETQTNKAGGETAGQTTDANAQTETTVDKTAEGDKPAEAQAQGVGELAEVVKSAVSAAVKPLEERLAKLEGAPAAAASEGANATEEVTTTKAAEKQESLFKGVL